MSIDRGVVAPIIEAVWVAFCASAILAYPIWKLLLRTKSRQTVSQYAPEAHQIKQGTPTMGGLIIAVGFLAASVALLGRSAFYVASIALFAGFMAIGFVDDYVVPRMLKGKRGLGWKQKIVMQLAVAVLGTGLAFGWQFDFEFAACVFVVLFFSNAYNFSDGLDGLAGTLLLGIVFGLLGICFLIPGGGNVALLVAPFIGAAIPFLFLNAPPAKVFMGDVGSLPVGAVLGLAVALLTFGGSRLGSASTYGLGAGLTPVNLACAIVSLVMVVELVPVPMQILSVKLLKRRIFPYTPIHHAFEKAGWPETRVVAMFALAQLVLSLVAVSLLAGFSVTSKP